MLPSNYHPHATDRAVVDHRRAALARRGLDPSAPVNGVILELAWPTRDRDVGAFRTTPFGVAMGAQR